MQRFSKFNQMVHVVTNGLERVKNVRDDNDDENEDDVEKTEMHK
jgi:hypothetical protein